MFRSFVAVLLLILSLTLFGCSTGIGGLKKYVSNTKGYQFFYPNGWVPVDVRQSSEGVDIVFRDIVERTENLSVVISSVPENQTLKDLGTPSEVGYRFMKKVNQDPSSGREAELIRADERESDEHAYYTLEYQVKQPDDGERHNLASVAISHGKLFTFNVSTRQNRWGKVKNLFELVVNSFSVY
jgi:photosystem II oxygen-evolving enhancer protein 2